MTDPGRSRLFDNLIDPVKDLLILLHGTKENFLFDRLTLLDRLLLEYDTNAGNEDIVVNLGKSIFLDIPYLVVDPDMYFLTTLETYILGIRETEKSDPISECRQGFSAINPKTIKRLDQFRSIYSS